MEFNPVPDDSGEIPVTYISFKYFSNSTFLDVPDYMDREKITYSIDEGEEFISEYKLKMLEISPFDYGHSRVTFRYENLIQIVDITIGEEE